MQAPYPPPVPAPKKTSPWLWVALGCGLPVGFIVLGIIGLAVLVGGNSKTTSKGTTTTTGNGATVNIARYAGKWRGKDGTFIWIRGDGKGDFDAGSTHVTGGGVTVDETAKTLAVTSFFGIGKTWKLDKAPKTEDSATMTLDGIVYNREGAAGDSNTSSSETSSGNDSTSGSSSESSSTGQLSAVPSPAECDKLAQATLTAFDEALGARDFTNFYNDSSSEWRKQTTPEEMKAAFKSFLDKNIRLNKTLQAVEPIYDKPRFEETNFSPEGMLVLRGYYPTKPYKVYFEISYLKDGAEWRPAKFNINIGNPIK